MNARQVNDTRENRGPIDSHCHLQSLPADERERALDAARERGVAGFLVPAIRLSEAEDILALCHRHPDVWCALGVHPHEASHWQEGDRGRLADLLADPKAVAVGECGLDFHYDFAPRDAQFRCVREQWSLAVELGLPVVARLVGWQVVGVEPRIMGIGPVPAVSQLLARLGLSGQAIDEVELNEAFASQVLACLQGLPDLDPERVNRDGGAIALGHPIGATGARIVVTLLHGLAARGGQRGLATLCVSGGMGLAALVEMEGAAA